MGNVGIYGILGMPVLPTVSIPYATLRGWFFLPLVRKSGLFLKAGDVSASGKITAAGSVMQYFSRLANQW